MKARFFYIMFYLFFLLNNQVFAGPVLGANITYTCLSPGFYELALDVYRDCNEPSLPASMTLDYIGPACGSSGSITVNLVGGYPLNISPICSAASSSCNSGNDPGVEHYLYKANFILPPVCTEFIFSWSSCCRSFSITNIDNSLGSPPIYVQSKLDISSIPCNTSPQFLNDPIFYTCVGVTTTLNNGAMDIEGDSLVYSLIDCQQDQGTAIVYTSPFSGTNPLTSAPPITIDPQTGSIEFNSASAEITIICVLVEEYRAGSKIGSIVQDIQIETTNCSNQIPDISGVNGSASDFTFTTCPNASFCFDVFAVDGDFPDVISLKYDNSISGASFSQVTGGSGPNSIDGTFCWTPTSGDVGKHFFTLSVEDDNCPVLGKAVYTYTVEVIDVGDDPISAGADLSICSGSSVTLSATTSSAGPINYSWSPASTLNSPFLANPDATPTATTTYFVTALYPSTCQYVDDVIVNISSSITTSISATTIACNGDSATITVGATGGAGSLTYTWSGGSSVNFPTNQDVVSGAIAGIYNVTVSDGSGCEDITGITITEPSVISVSTVSIIDPSCAGSSDGDAFVAASGGAIGPYSFIWDASANNQTSNLATGLSAGVHCVTVGDVNSCTVSHCVTLTVPSALTVNSSQNDVSCNGGNDGDATITPLGGTGTISYLWDASAGNQTTFKISGLFAGVYCVTVSDGNNCALNACITITEPSFPLVANAVVDSMAQCYGVSDGGVSVTVLGGTSGTGNYSYIWNTGQTTSALIGLSANTYYVTVTDDNDCSSIDSAIVQFVPAVATPDINAVDSILCEGDDIQFITSTVAAGYFWSGPNGFVSFVQNPTIFTADIIEGGTYYLYVEDASGCASNDTSIYINVNDLPAIPDISGSGNVCSGTAFTLTEINLATPDSLSWIGPVQAQAGTFNTLTVQPADPNYVTGIWTVQNIDTYAGCISESSPIFVNILPTPSAPVPTSSSPVCIGDFVDLAVPFLLNATVNWYADSTKTLSVGNGENISVSNITFDTTFYVEYVLNGCTSPLGSIIVLVNPIPAAPDAPADFDVCEGQNINLFTSFANSYNWSHSGGFVSTQQNPTIVSSVLGDAGAYTLNIIDANGCTSPDTTVLVEVYVNPTAPTITPPVNVCYGDSVLFTASGLCGENRWIGPAGGVYLVSSTNFGIPTSSADYIDGDWYLICVDVITGCSSISNTVNVTITTPPVPPGVFNSGPVCIGNSVDLTAALIANVNYFWYADSTLSTFVANGFNPTIPNITTDSTFYLKVELNGCFSYNNTQVFVFPVSAKPNISPDLTICEGENIFLATSTPADSYHWTSPLGVTYTDSVIVISPANISDGGNYLLSIIDTNGCQVPDTSVVVTVNAKPSAPTIVSTPICDGDNLVLTVSTGCDSIEWTGPSGIPFRAGDTIIVFNSNSNYIDGGSWTASCVDTNTNCISNPSTVHNVTINITPPIPSALNDGPVCIGDAVQLSTPLVASASYTWYTMDSVTIVGSGAILTVSNITTDTAFLVVVTVNGCDAFDSTQVQVITVPLTPSVPSSIDICENDTLFLTTSTNAPGYNWSGPQGFSSNQQNPFVYPVTSSNTGLYTLSVMDVNLCISLDTTVLVTVNSLPSSPTIFSTGPTTFCFGDSIQIKSNIPCDQSIWFSPTGNTPVADSITIDSLSPDYASGDWNMICVDTSTGCQSISNTVTFVINPLPSVPIITHTGPVCSGDSVDITMQIVTNGTYEWFNIEGTLMGTTYTINVPGITLDTAFLGVVTVNGCSAQDSVQILVNSIPSTPDISALSDTICEFDFLQLSTSTIATSYNWSGPNGFSSNSSAPSISIADILNDGIYYLNVSSANSCTSLDTSIRIVVNPLPFQPSISGATSICNGDTILLQGSTCDRLIWYPPGGATQISTKVSSLQVPSSSPDYLSGIWLVSCEDTLTGCFSPVSSDHNLSINALPSTVSPTNDGPVCVNSGVNLTVIPQTASTYIWSSDSLMTDTVGLGTSIFVDSIAADSTFYVQITNSSGCDLVGSTLVTISSGPLLPTIISADTFICEGADIQLGTIASGVSYFWSGPNGFVSNQASPLINTASVLEGGMYYLYVEDVSGCASPADSILIVVNSPPPVPVVSGGTNVCYGDTVVVTSSVTCDSSEWIGNSGSFLFQNVLGQLEITVSDAEYINTDWTLICHDTSTGCYSISNTTFVTIISVPGQPAIINNGPVCDADSVVLSTPLIFNTTNSWYADSLLTIPLGTGDTMIVYNITVDSTFYLQQIYNGCASPIASTDVTHLNVPLAPVVPLSITVCVGDAINLTTSTNANAYLWTHSGGFTSTLQNPVITSATISDSGLYDLAIIDTNGCTAPITSVSVTVNSLPSAPVISFNDPICEGDAINLGSNTPSNVKIEWVTPNNDTITGNPGLVVLSADSNYLSGLWTVVFKDTLTGCQISGDTVININSAPIPGNISNNDPVCIGDSVQLSTTSILSATAYYWKTADSVLLGSGLNIVIPNIISDTSFLLFIENALGCIYLMDSIPVTVYPQTPAPSVSVDSIVCEGDDIQFTTTPAAAYNWSGPNGFTSNLQNPLISPSTLADSGMYTLSITDLNGCASLNASVNVHVNALPATPVATVLSSICQGDTLFLNSNATVCDTAYWVGPSSTVEGANVSLSAFNFAYQSGDWQVFCVDTTTGCESGSNIVNVTINQTPVSLAVNNSPVCIFESVQLTAAFIPSASYDWYSDNALNNFVDSLQVIQVDSIFSDSTFYLVVTDSNGCNSLSSTTVNLISPASAPFIGPDVQVCEGGDINLTTPVVASGYNWSGPNGFTSNLNNPTILNATSADSGLYYLSVTDSFGCNSYDTTLYVTIDSLPAQPVISGFVNICDGDTLFLYADSTSSHCDSILWIGPNGQNFPVLVNNPVILPTDTNYVSGLWQLHCIDTSTGCSTGSNISLVVISASPDTQAVFTDSPVCYGGSVSLSTVSAGSLASYTWYGDSTQTIIAGVGQNTTVNGITNDTTFYLVVTNSGGCSSEPIPAIVFVLPANSSPSSAPDTQICEGDPIQLSTGNSGIGYLWISSNGYVDTTQAPLVTLAATVLDSGEYMCYVTDSNGCTYLDTWFHLSVNTAPPIPTITSNAPLCFGDTLNIVSGSQCIQSQWIGPNGNSPAVLGSPGGGNVLWTFGSTTAIPSTDSNYLSGDWYMICIDTATGCQSASDTINISIDSMPLVLSVSNSGPVCIGDSVGLNVSAFTASGFPLISTWYSDINLTTVVAIGNSVFVPNVTSAGVYYVQITDSQTGCSSLDSTTVTVITLPNAPFLPSDTILCEGESIVLTTITSAINYLWSGPNGFSSNSQFPTPFASTVLDSGTYSLQYIDANGCLSAIETIHFTINPIPPIPLVSNSGPGCIGDSIVLSTATIPGVSFSWFKLPLGSGAWSGQNITLTNLTLSDTGYYYVVASVNGCTSFSDSTFVSVISNNLITPFAGLDQTLCGQDTLTLNGSVPPNNISGLWTTNSTAVIVTPNSSTTLLANLPVGISVFYWTFSSNICQSSSVDTVIITVLPQSTDVAFAGTDQYLCGDSVTILSATLPVISIGTWTQSTSQAASGVNITNTSDPSSGITGLQPGNSYLFVWELSNGICGIHSTDTIVVDINIAPSDNAIAGGDILTCTHDTLTLAASNSSIGTGLWTTGSSAVIISPAQNNTIVTNLLQDTTMFIWTLSNGTCINYSSDTMLVILGGGTPVANSDSFSVVPGSSITVDVLPNDNLTSSWNIYINTPMSSGQMINLNNGQFDLDFQGVTTDQSFIYELCNPDCPAICDTAIVLLELLQIVSCDIPNIFTPNGDGVNDVFEIPCLFNTQGSSLIVFNRWGDLVYETDNYQNQWDGTYNGQPLPDGTYFYIIRIGTNEKNQGSVEIRR